MDYVFITDLHFKSSSKVRSGNVLEDMVRKLKFVVDYCNSYDAALLLGGDIFDKSTVPDFVKSEIAPVLTKVKNGVYAIPGNHDRLYDNPEYNFKTSYNVLVSHGVIEDLTTIDFGDVILTSEVPVVTKGKPQIVVFHGFLNIEDGRSTFHFTDIQTTDNCVVCLGHDHVEYETLQYNDTVKIIRPGSFHRDTRVETNFRTPKLVHLRVKDGKILSKFVPIECRDFNEVFTAKETKITKAQQHDTYEAIIEHIRNAQVTDLTFEQAMSQVAEPDVVEFAIQVLTEEKLNKSLNRV